MQRLNNGDRTVHSAQAVEPATSRKHAGLLVLCTSLALLMCMFTPPAVHAATTTTHNATASVAATAGVNRLSPAVSRGRGSSIIRKKDDCSAYFDALFDAVNGLDQAMAVYDSTDGSSLIAVVVNEAYVMWAAANVNAAESNLEGCLGR